MNCVKKKKAKPSFYKSSHLYYEKNRNQIPNNKKKYIWVSGYI